MHIEIVMLSSFRFRVTFAAFFSETFVPFYQTKRQRFQVHSNINHVQEFSFPLPLTKVNYSYTSPRVHKTVITYFAHIHTTNNALHKTNCRQK